MTIKYRSSSLIYFLLFFSGSHCLVLKQQKTQRRHRRRINYLRTSAQGFSVPYKFEPKKFSHSFGFKPPSTLGSAYLPPIKVQKSMEILQRRLASIDHITLNTKLDSKDTHSPHLSICESCNSPTKAPKTTSPPLLVKDNSCPRLQSHRPSRLSLSLPVAPSRIIAESTSTTPTKTILPTFDLSSQTLLSPGHSNCFLVALAGQERHVFELREELTKAEAELERLKEEWKHYEAQGKKGELRNIETMRILQSPGHEENENKNLESTIRPSLEADKRKALFENTKNPKESRRVFSGSHTRTLSLLSPERSSFALPNQVDSLQNQKRKEKELPRNNVLLNTSRAISSNRVKNLYNPKIVTNGAKQFVELAEEFKQGFKEGVMTLIDDLRQATVGDEGVNGANAYKRSSTETSITNSEIVNKVAVMNTNLSKRSTTDSNTLPRTWENLFGNPLPNQTSSESKKCENKSSSSENKKSKSLSLAISSVNELDDPWSNWESPNTNPPRWSGSTTVPDSPSPPDSGFFDQEFKTISRSSAEPTRVQKPEDSSWLGLKNLSSEKLKDDLQKTWSTVLKELETNTVPRLGDKCEPSSQPSISSTTTVLSNSPEQSSSQEELLFMSR